MRLGLDFYARSADVVAQDMLGKVLLFKDNGVLRKGRIVETEAYLGEQDLASHASKGRTKRTEILFGPPAFSYVYLIYGMYHMFNIVTDKEGSAHAVLIRAIEPIGNLSPKTNGPGKLCKAMNLTMQQNKLSMLEETLWLEQGTAPEHILSSARIGIDYAKDWKDVPLRFFDANSSFVSGKNKLD